MKQAIRVAVVGAESTGKTTLTRLLAAEFKTRWVPEYGRAYTSSRELVPWTTAEFIHIAQRQAMNENLAGWRLAFCDTDLMTTAIFHEVYMGYPSEELEAYARTRRYDLTFVLAVDFPFAEDDLRHDQEIQRAMDLRIREWLTTRPEPVVELSGSVEERLARARLAIAELLS